MLYSLNRIYSLKAELWVAFFDLLLPKINFAYREVRFMPRFEGFFGGGVNFSTLSIPSIRLSDVIDIILVAVLIYYVVRWFRQTRAWALFQGLLMIGIISFLAYKLHFYTITFIIERTFSVGIIALIVIFQPELRKGLEQIGTGGFKSLSGLLGQTRDVKLSEKSVNEIVNACSRMSAVKTGALIVIENNVPTGEFTQKSGTMLDSEISEQLLINIFWKNTPLHDGAVVIKNDRIISAACVLPSTEKEIGRELGTRHRAAVGASEVTDATVVVVSEETGNITAVVDGKMHKKISADELKKILMQLTDNAVSIGDRIKGKGKGHNRNEKNSNAG